MKVEMALIGMNTRDFGALFEFVHNQRASEMAAAAAADDDDDALLLLFVSRCSCLDWQPVSVSSHEVKHAAEHVVAIINNMTSSQSGLCARLWLSDVISAVRYVTSDQVLVCAG